MDIHDSIDPKAFSSFEEYQNALKLHDEFVERSAAASEVMRSAETPEEERRGMEALGFTYHEDASCGRTWCEERKECLWCSVLSWQEECNDHFFAGLLADADLLMPKEIQGRCLSGEGCEALLPSWHQEGSSQRKAILWFLDMMDALIFGSSRTVPFDDFHLLHPEMDEWVRDAYFMALHYGRGRLWPDARLGKQRIKNALMHADLPDPKRATVLIASFRTLCDSNH
ncbi:hypothetical protein HYZ99_01660 [Candidatus Peregrinibacteria bacterium]|nr:hypothetical protein [Candidatus Peregrinibacteria bacterium]